MQQASFWFEAVLSVLHYPLLWQLFGKASQLTAAEIVLWHILQMEQLCCLYCLVTGGLGCVRVDEGTPTDLQMGFMTPLYVNMVYVVKVG